MKQNLIKVGKWLLVLPAYFLGWYVTFQILFFVNKILALFHPIDIGIKGLPYFFAYIGAVIGGIEAASWVAPINKNKMKLCFGSLLLLNSLVAIFEHLMAINKGGWSGENAISMIFTVGEFLVILFYLFPAFMDLKIKKLENVSPG